MEESLMAEDSHTKAERAEQPLKQLFPDTGAGQAAVENNFPLHLLDTMFQLPDNDYTQYSPLALAYIGDAVYDLCVRTILVRRANMQAAKLHHKASQVVRAQSQAKAIRSLQELLTDPEKQIVHRGQNAKPPTMPKNASREDYLAATGYEALIGYLYLTRQYERLLELVAAGLHNTKQSL